MSKEKIIKDMLDKCNQNVLLRHLKVGKLVRGKDAGSIEVEYNGKRYYLVHVPYDMLVDGERKDIHGTVRKNIATEFMQKYSFEGIVSNYNKYVEGINAKISKANYEKQKLENVVAMLKEESSINANFEIKANQNLYKYYIEYNLGLGNKVEIYMEDDYEKYDCKYNSKRLSLNNIGIKNLIKEMEAKYKANLVVKEQEKLSRLSSAEKEAKLKQFVDSICFEGVSVIVKLKSGYQVIEKGRRYAVGDGKEGKYMRLATYTKTLDYIKSKGINEYVVLDGSIKTYNLTNKDLKGLPYKKIIG